MAKPGVKEIRENNYKLNITGVLKIDGNVIKVDVSEESNGSDVIDILSYFEQFDDELVSISLKKSELLDV